MSDLGKLVAEARRLAGLRKAELARLSGVEEGHIARLENGSSANPTLGVLAALAGAFGLTVPQLLLGRKPKTRKVAP